MKFSQFALLHIQLYDKCYGATNVYVEKALNKVFGVKRNASNKAEKK